MMIPKLIINFLVVFFLFGVVACSTNGLDVTDYEQTKLVQRGSMILHGGEGAIELKLGDITAGRVDVKITGVSNGKEYFQSTLEEGGDGVFKYSGRTYMVKINSFEEHTFHDDFAFIEFREMPKE